MRSRPCFDPVNYLPMSIAFCQSALRVTFLCCCFLVLYNMDGGGGGGGIGGSKGNVGQCCTFTADCT